ncbi:MAG: creatininase family protein [Clostridia bacterium]|nr:creatininase family protein [Clostridia bacterium]
MAFYMEEMSVRDLERAMEKTSTVIIPVGVVEQHGYHLPLSTDMHNSVQLTRKAGDRLNAVVAPILPYCFSGGTLLGTVNVSPNTFGLMISEICSEFVRMGFKNIIVLLGHAGTDNKAALKNTLQMLLRRDEELAKKITLSLVECWDLSQTWLDGFAMLPEHDFHAGMIETSLMMYWKPELVQDEIVMDDEYTSKMMRTDQDWFEKREKPIDHPFIVEKVGQRDEIKVGVMGFPERATRELGEKVCNEMVEGLIEYVDMLENNSKCK